MRGGYLRKTLNARGKRVVKLCDASHRPIGYVYKPCKVLLSVVHVKAKDKKDGKLTLNLVAVRQLHGKSYIKKQYQNARIKTTATL